MANETYSFEIAAEVAKARKAVESFAKDTQKQLDGIKSTNSTTALATSFIAIKEAASAAFSFVSEVINTTISESLEAEKANIQLANSMKLVGDFTQEAVAQFDDYATALSKTSEASDDEIKASLALAKSFQLTNSEAKRVVTAATELSAIIGDSLNSSVEKLAKTFNGALSKELKQLAPELRNLTRDQLANGDAVDIVASKYRGSASVLNDSFGGALGQVKKSVGELLEEIGNLITRTQTFKEGLQGTASEIDAVSDAIKNGNFLKLFFNVQVGEGFVDASKRLEQIKIDAEAGSDALKDFTNELKKSARADTGRAKADSDIRLARDRAAALEEYNKIREQVEISGLSEIEKINKDAYDKIKVIRNAINIGALDDVKKAQKEIAGIELDRIKKTAEAEKKEAEKTKAEIEKIRAQNEKVARNPFGVAAGKAIRGQGFTEQEARAAAAGFINTVLKGAEGAKQAVASVIGEIADKLVPGIGPVVSEIVNVLAQGPEKVRETVPKPRFGSLPYLYLTGVSRSRGKVKSPLRATTLHSLRIFPPPLSNTNSTPSTILSMRRSRSSISPDSRENARIAFSSVIPISKILLAV